MYLESLILLRNQAQDGAGIIEYNVNSVVGTANDIADATGIFENDFFVHDAVILNIQQADVLVLQCTHQQFVVPLGEQVAMIEIQTAGGGGGAPVENGLLHALLANDIGDGGVVVVNAVGDDRPAIVLPGLDQVDLVAALGAMFGFP